MLGGNRPPCGKLFNWAVNEVVRPGIQARESARDFQVGRDGQLPLTGDRPEAPSTSQPGKLTDRAGDVENHQAG